MSRILLIDDDPSIRDVIGQMLASVGHTVVTAGDGRSGCIAFEQNRPELVITDIIMPDREGIETIKALRTLDPSIPIIAISGGGRTGNMDFLELAAKLGANRTLAKPFSRTALNEAISALLKPPSTQTPAENGASKPAVNISRG